MAAVLALVFLGVGAVAHAQISAAPAAAKSASGSAARTPVKPLWIDITPAQRQALAPLADDWDLLGEAHKRKWIAMAANFGRLPPAEQIKLHSRMREWVALSPSQRTQARLNFGETQQLSSDEKKAKWEAYQALPLEEKRKLAADATVKPPTTAAAVKPVPPQKLATVPRPNPTPDEARPARATAASPAEVAAPSSAPPQ